MVAIRTAVIVLIALLCTKYTVAQTDSIVYQYWKRDANTDVTSVTSNQKQIITKDQITLSGYPLLSDVFQLIDGFTLSTWNGDRWNIRNNGSGNYQTQNWILMLDGQRIELLKLDAQHINSISINVQDIERIEIVNAVGNYLGEFNENGIIHIITKQNKIGLTYRCFFNSGNEIGDPHIDKYSRRNPNIDKYGVSLGNHIGYKKGKWDLQLTQYANDFFYRDPKLYEFVFTNNPGIDVRNTLRSGRASISYTGSNITHHVSAIMSSIDDVITPAGILNPITAKHNYQSGAYTLRYVLPKGVVQYKGTFSNRLFEGSITHEWISHTQQYQTHLLNYTFNKQNNKGNKIYQVGIAYDGGTVRFDMNPNAANYATQNIRSYFSYTLPLTKRSSFFSDISLGTNTKVLLPKLSLGYYKQPSIMTNWSLVLGYTTRSLTEDQSYLSFVSLSKLAQNSQTFDSYSQASIDYYYNINVSKHFKVAFNSGYKIINNQPVLIPTNTTVMDSVILGRMMIAEINQQCWTNRLTIHYDMLKNIGFDFNYLRNDLINGSETSPHNIPKHKLTLCVTYALPARLYIWTRYYYQSKTEWIQPYYNQFYASIDDKLPYSSLPSINGFDIGFTKKLLKDYLLLNLSVRNVFNNFEQYQSFGAQYDLRIFMSAALNIDGLFAQSK